MAVANPVRFDARRRWLEGRLGRVHMIEATEDEVHGALLAQRRRALAKEAERRVYRRESCRGRAPRRFAMCVAVSLGFGLAVALAWPVLAFSLLVTWATLVLAATTLLRATAAVLHLRHPHLLQPAPPPVVQSADLPLVSLLVPLFKEDTIAEHLLARLAALDYPADRLDICLIVEEGDVATQRVLRSGQRLPQMRVITVPAGAIQTKPRAMNYALDFARGSIVGIYDAEDAPAPEQLRRVVARFLESGDDLACIQGVLDFYNARSNWLSRCFTIEYTSWFRIILPGLARMGLVIPLGGTSVFFRRDALEALGGWDAHNVTEDADLGLRLARHGYRTELLDTITREESNCRLWPWVRQRARWLKGYAQTYAVHMRRPTLLWSQLGAWKFLGVQLVYFGTLSQFLLAPLLWSFWLIPLGLPHPLNGLVPWPVFVLLGSLFFLSELVNIAVGGLAALATNRRWLVKWVPTMHVYFPLGALAAYRGMLDLIWRPYYWDKTVHGLFTDTDDGRARAVPVSRRGG